MRYTSNCGCQELLYYSLPSVLLFSCALILGSLQVSAQDLSSSAPIKELEEVGIDQQLDSQIPLDLQFTNERGETIVLGNLFGKKPVILTLVYYECPMLCTEVLNGTLRALRPLRFQVGNEMDVVTVSIDPDESSSLAMIKKQEYLRQYNREGAGDGWHFLTGSEASVRALADSVGFHYKYIPEIDQYSHAAAIMLLTPRGRVSRYFFGVEYSSRDLRLGVIEASEEGIGSPVDQVLLYCYSYDPSKGKYSLVIWNVIRLAGFAMIFLVGGFIVFSLLREKRAAAAGRA